MAYRHMLTTKRYCKKCGDVIHPEAPWYADECLACWEDKGGSLSPNGWRGLANHINASWDLEDYIGMMIQYEYNMDCEYT